MKLGFRSTRYKDLFDFYYLINTAGIDKEKLSNCLDILIFKDESMKENNINDILSRLKQILSDEETEITNNYCGIQEEGIPNKIWNGEETCEDFIEDEEPDKINVNSPNIEDKITLNN